MKRIPMVPTLFYLYVGKWSKAEIIEVLWDVIQMGPITDYYMHDDVEDNAENNLALIIERLSEIHKSLKLARGEDK